LPEWLKGPILAQAGVQAFRVNVWCASIVVWHDPNCSRFFPARRILAFAAAAEARLKHPVSQALVAKAHADGVEIPEQASGEFEIGLGVEAQINGCRAFDRLLRNSGRVKNPQNKRVCDHHFAAEKSENTGCKVQL
jgi:cation transport ATPase